MNEQWKEIELGSPYQISDLGRFKYRGCYIQHPAVRQNNERYIWIGKNDFPLHQVVVAIFMYGDLSLCGKLNIGFKDSDRTNCSLSNLYIKDDLEGVYLNMVKEAALVCDTAKQMHKYLHDKGYLITIHELADIKRDHKIRCGTKRKGKFTLLGESKTLKDWAMGVGMLPATLKKRLQRGWSLEKALKIPVLDSKSFRIH